MIEEFSFGNFTSFKEVNTLNFVASKQKSKYESIDDNNLIKINDKTSLLKVKAIYGANASGKSNILKALITFIRIVVDSFKNEDELDRITPYLLSTETENEPSFFQVVIRINDVRYRYGFQATNKEIISEWLFGNPNNRETEFFLREGNEVIFISENHFKEGARINKLNKNIEPNSQIFRKNSLFLSSIAAFNGKLSNEIIKKLSSFAVITGLGHDSIISKAIREFEKEEMKPKIVKFLKYADVGITHVVKEELFEEESKLEENKKVKHIALLSKRHKYNPNNNDDYTYFLMKEESEGTRKMFEISSFIIKALEKGSFLFIDELDARFHPSMTKKIVELFASISNKEAQFAFVTHDVNLLSSDLLRRDQIEFVEKDSSGESHLYSLAEFKGIRNTDSFEKDYINGKYGAIPFLGNFNKLFY